MVTIARSAANIAAGKRIVDDALEKQSLIRCVCDVVGDPGKNMQ